MHHSLEEYRAARPDGDNVGGRPGLSARITVSVLRRYGTMMTPAYLRRTYPGLSTEELALQRIRTGALWAALIGAMTGLAMTVGDLGISLSFGLTLLITLGAVFADALLFVRQQIRTVFDLSVIYGTPLDPDDPEDCTVLTLTALGASAGGAVGTGVVPIAHRIIEARSNNLLRSGARAALRGLATRLGGIEFAKKLGERAVLRAALPVLSIAIGALVNFAFSKVFSARARKFLNERATVVRPLLRLTSLEPDLPRLVLMMMINTVINEVRGSDWTEAQEAAVRHAELFLRFRDQDHDAMTRWVEAGMPESAPYHEFISEGGRAALFEFLETVALLDCEPNNVRLYRESIDEALERLDQPEIFEHPSAWMEPMASRHSVPTNPPGTTTDSPTTEEARTEVVGAQLNRDKT